MILVENRIRINRTLFEKILPDLDEIFFSILRFLVSRINFTHITISVHSLGSSLVAIGTRRHYMVHRSQDSCEA